MRDDEADGAIVVAQRADDDALLHAIEFLPTARPAGRG